MDSNRLSALGAKMPVSVKKIGKKYRLVEPGGKIAKTSGGNPRDGGGHSSKEKAERQRFYMNSGAKLE